MAMHVWSAKGTLHCLTCAHHSATHVHTTLPADTRRARRHTGFGMTEGGCVSMEGRWHLYVGAAITAREWSALTVCFLVLRKSEGEGEGCSDD